MSLRTPIILTDVGEQMNGSGLLGKRRRLRLALPSSR